MQVALSEEQLIDISLAYNNEEILDLLQIETIELVHILQEQIEENILKFNLRPVDCNYDF